MIHNEPQDPQVSVDRDLLNHLRSVYPDKIPMKMMTKYDIAKLQGNQEVIKHIEYLANLKSR